MDPISLDFPDLFSVLKEQSSVIVSWEEGSLSGDDVWTCFENCVWLVTSRTDSTCKVLNLYWVYISPRLSLCLSFEVSVTIFSILFAVFSLFTNSSSLLPPLFPNRIDIWPTVHSSLTFSFILSVPFNLVAMQESFLICLALLYAIKLLLLIILVYCCIQLKLLVLFFFFFLSPFWWSIVLHCPDLSHFLPDYCVYGFFINFTKYTVCPWFFFKKQKEKGRSEEN